MKPKALFFFLVAFLLSGYTLFFADRFNFPSEVNQTIIIVTHVLGIIGSIFLVKNWVDEYRKTKNNNK